MASLSESAQPERAGQRIAAGHQDDRHAGQDECGDGHRPAEAGEPGPDGGLGARPSASAVRIPTPRIRQRSSVCCSGARGLGVGALMCGAG
jgi:hypothetical protein